MNLTSSRAGVVRNFRPDLPVTSSNQRAAVTADDVDDSLERRQPEIKPASAKANTSCPAHFTGKEGRGYRDEEKDYPSHRFRRGASKNLI